MAKVSRDSATQGGEFGPVVDRSDQLEGYTVNFTSVREDIDLTPLMKGLPDDRCQCPHWGYVIKGGATYRYADREEVFEAGDALLHAARPHPRETRARHRGRDLQPRRGAAQDRGGRDEEHAGDAGRLNGQVADARPGSPDTATGKPFRRCAESL